MHTKNRHIISLMASLLRAARADGVLQEVLDEIPEIGDLFVEFHETAQWQRPPYVGPSGLGASKHYQIHYVTPSVPANGEALSSRQRDVLKLIAEGRSNKEIARIVGITPETVKTHVRNIFIKLSVDRRAQAVSRAQSLGLVGHQYGELVQ